MAYDDQEVNNLPYNEILKLEIHAVISGKVIYAPVSDEKYNLIVKLLNHKKFQAIEKVNDLLRTGTVREKPPAMRVVNLVIPGKGGSSLS